jgi:hypothetical protein
LTPATRKISAKACVNRRVAVVDQTPGVPEQSVDGIRQVSRHLLRPRTARVVRDAGQLNAPGLQIDDEEDRVAKQPVHRQDLHAEEVGGGDGSPVRLQERSPGRPLAALGCWIEFTHPATAETQSWKA